MKSEADLVSVRGAATPAVAVLAAFGLSQALPANADPFLPGSGVTLVSGSSSQTVPFQITSAGTLTVTLDNLPLGQRLDSLSFMMSTATTPMQSSWTPVANTDTESFKVGPGTYFAHIMGDAGGSLDLGIYGLYVSFQPTVVPLPASGWMLLTGVFVMIGFTRLVCTWKPGDWKTLEGEVPATDSVPA
jgi:hypothetical protein